MTNKIQVFNQSENAEAFENTKRSEGNKLISVKEASRICGIGRSMAYQLASTGTWPTVKIGDRILVPLHQLERWIESNIQGGTEEVLRR